VREWVRLGGRLPSAEEVVQPKRLLLQIHSDEELLHNHLDTRVRNRPDGIQQTPLSIFDLTFYMKTGHYKRKKNSAHLHFNVLSHLYLSSPVTFPFPTVS
ncbi:hypothetical protein GOODEAATRI_024687, partial [Goodea atripinnis]